MKNKKIINEEIKRIHELMGIDSLINEILDDVFSLNLINESLLPTLIRSASRLDNLVRVADNIKASTIVDSAGNLLRAAEIPHATELSNLSNDADAFVKRLLEFADDAVGTPTRKVADEVINSFISEVHAQSTELKNLQDTVNNVKNELTTNQGKTVDEANEEIQAAIDRTFYGDDAKVEFATPQLRDIYVYKLRKDLGLDTKWTRPTRPVPPEDTRTPEEIYAELELVKKQAIDAKFDSYKKIGEDLEKLSKRKGDDPPFKMPNIFKKDNLKEELFTAIRDKVDSRFRSKIEADEADISKWLDQLERLTPAEKERAIKEAAQRATNATKRKSEKILGWLKEKGYDLSVGTVKEIRDLPSKTAEFFTLLGKGNVKEALSGLKSLMYRLIALIAMDVINQYGEWYVRKYYDKDLPLPTFMVGAPPIQGTISEWLSWGGKLLISKPIFIYDILATLGNAFTGTRYSQESGGITFKDELSNEVSNMKKEGVLPETQLDSADQNSEVTLNNFLDKVMPDNAKQLKAELEQDGFTWADVLGASFQDLDVNFDVLFGLPIDQFYVVGKDIYFVNKNGRFKVQGLDTDNPTIKGKEGVDGEEKTVDIKNLFSNEDGETINRFMRDFYPVEEQTKLQEKSTDYPKTITEQPGFSKPEVSSAVGLVSTTPTALSQQLTASNISGLDMDNFVTYNFYNPSEVEPNPTLPGYFKPKDSAKSIESALYYIDKKGQKDANGNYPVFRVVKTSKDSGKYKPNTWYVRMPEGDVTWKELKNVIGDENISAPSASAAKSPKEKWEEEHPGVKLTQTGAIGELVTYSGSDGKRYKQENGQIVEF